MSCFLFDKVYVNLGHECVVILFGNIDPHPHVDVATLTFTDQAELCKLFCDLIGDAQKCTLRCSLCLAIEITKTGNSHKIIRNGK